MDAPCIIAPLLIVQLVYFWQDQFFIPTNLL
jgi:hypothetical protein